jgi:uncharacterized protein (TIGR00255 family)
MTGFGKATGEYYGKKITVELKSLNSKQLDISLRLPPLYRQKEMELRNLITRSLERGKIEMFITCENMGLSGASPVNQDVVEGYYRQIKESTRLLGISEPADWFQIFVRLPDAFKTESAELEEDEWECLSSLTDLAAKDLISFRNQEGEAMCIYLQQKIDNIAHLLLDVEPFEKERVEKIKQRIEEALAKIENFEYDTNRMEQEMIFYIEKLDISEEKARLHNHLQYFSDTLKAEKGQGKKLGFIAQEMGREINTLGSKSNHAEMQRIVVEMKDELEQLKEQILNVL